MAIIRLTVRLQPWLYSVFEFECQVPILEATVKATGSIQLRSSLPSRDVRRLLANGYVYTLKRGEAVVSGTDVHYRALVRMASDLTELGEGGGVVRLLLPTNPAAQRRLACDRQYRLVLVRSRNPGLRGLLRASIACSAVMRNLVSIAPVHSNWRKKSFAGWLVQELRNPNSDVTRILGRIAPDLLETERSESWWYRNLKFRKMSR